MAAKGSTCLRVYASMRESPAATFEAQCRARRLAFQVAPDGSAVFPPRLAAPGTGAPLQWSVSAGRGAVYAATVVRRRGEEPSSVVLVDLDEGFRMMSRVEGLAPEDVRIGLRVTARFTEDDPPLVFFVPEDAA
jgi:uncharacterized OB-fold protein